MSPQFSHTEQAFRDTTITKATGHWFTKLAQLFGFPQIPGFAEEQWRRGLKACALGVRGTLPTTMSILEGIYALDQQRYIVSIDPALPSRITFVDHFAMTPVVFYTAMWNEDFEHAGGAVGSLQSPWSHDPVGGSGGSAAASQWAYQNVAGITTGGTGPSAAHQGSLFGWCETSSPNNPAKDFGAYAAVDATGHTTVVGADTTYEVSFHYHLFGADIGTLQVQSAADLGGSPGAWTNMSISWNGAVSTSAGISGQQQTAATDAWRLAKGTIPLTPGSLRYVRIFYTSGSGNKGDACIDDLYVKRLDTYPGAWPCDAVQRFVRLRGIGEEAAAIDGLYWTTGPGAVASTGYLDLCTTETSYWRRADFSILPTPGSTLPSGFQASDTRGLYYAEMDLLPFVLLEPNPGRRYTDVHQTTEALGGVWDYSEAAPNGVELDGNFWVPAKGGQAPAGIKVGRSCLLEMYIDDTLHASPATYLMDPKGDALPAGHPYGGHHMDLFDPSTPHAGDQTTGPFPIYFAEGEGSTQLTEIFDPLLAAGIHLTVHLIDFCDDTGL